MPRGASQALFSQSWLPMLIADDRRRYVDANRAACLFLRRSYEQVLDLGIDDLTPPEHREAMLGLWEEFLRDGIQAGLRRHISILDVGLRATDAADAEELGQPGRPLSHREREVLALVAMGETSRAISTALQISVTTVETHVRNCMSKLSAKSRPHAIALALKGGEISLT